MDFDSIIPFIFLLVFFILPGILKQIKAIKTQNQKPVKINKKPSIFDKISERIQQFVQELEQQAKQQKQAGRNQDSPWDALADDQTSSLNFETFEHEDDYFREPEYDIPDTAPSEAQIPAYHAAIEEPEDNTTRLSIKDTGIQKEPLVQHSVSADLIFKSNPLQNAIIWSEILGKPVGLRE